MAELTWAIYWLCILGVSLPTAVLGIEILASLFPTPALMPVPRRELPRFVVVIPAHNEGQLIAHTVAQVRRDISPGTKILVVADNCDDDTAAQARAVGAEVFERHEPSRPGKGFALAAAVQRLQREPPEVVVFWDADCRPSPGAIHELVRTAHHVSRPVQAVYLMEPPLRATTRDRISAFAFQLKNHIRPLGLRRLSLPCHLTGTGMAFPWSVIRRAPLATRSIVEDMELGIRLTLQGHPPTLCQAAVVYGDLPDDEGAARVQRTRWEHGSLRTAIEYIPRLIGAGMARAELMPLALGFDLCVPPLTLLVLMHGIVLLLQLAMFAAGVLSPLPLLLYLGELAIGSLLLCIAIRRFGARYVDRKTMLDIPRYVLWKLPVLAQFLVHREQRWIRTQRAHESVRAAPTLPSPSPFPTRHAPAADHEGVDP